MNIDNDRLSRIVNEFLEKSFYYNTVIDVTDNTCTTFMPEDRIVERSLPEFISIAKELTHPLFINKLETDLTNENLEASYKADRTIRVETLMQEFDKKEFHWFRLRLIPIDDKTGHTVFFFNCLLIDDDIKKSENNRSEIFNKAVLEQLIYDYILVYVIDLSNGMSHLVYSNEGDDYDTYAKQFKSHLEMMNDVCENYISDDFVLSFTKFMDYEYIKKQLVEKERLVLIFRDKNGSAFEMVVSKYPEYAEDYPVVIFSLKELS